jgi:hypothetical protein
MVVEPFMKRLQISFSKKGLQIWHLFKKKTVALHALQPQEHTVFLGHCHLLPPGI